MTPLLWVCGVLVLVGLAGVVRWDPAEVRPPGAGEPLGRPAPADVVRRFVWHLTVAVVSGAGSGILIAGAGGRLAMRLLAVTAGDAAQGQLTEAEEVVGKISTGGTIGLVLFAGLFFGVVSGALYLLIRRWLPAGRVGGLVYGALLLVLLATRVDPLRAGNPDFDIVGPGWLAVAVFGVIVIAHGMLVAGIAGRYSSTLPLISGERRALVAYSPLLVLLPLASGIVILALVGAIAVLLSRSAGLIRFVRSRSALVGGRVVLAAVGVAALPGCLSALSDIAGRTP